MSLSNLGKFKATIDQQKLICIINLDEFYIFDKVAQNLAEQYAQKLFGRRLGKVCSLRPGTHASSPNPYWNFEGYIGKVDKLGRVIEGRCINFNFTKDSSSIRTGTRTQRRLTILHHKIALEYSIPELQHQALQAKVLAKPDYFGVCPIPRASVRLADVLLD